MRHGLSDRALRDYAYKVLKSEFGERMDKGVIIPAQATDQELAGFVQAMPTWQLEQMYQMIYGSEMEV